MEYSEPPRKTSGDKIRVGNIESSSQLVDSIPIKKPSKLKVKDVKTSIRIIANGCII
jgi:hypothetical protein